MPSKSTRPIDYGPLPIDDGTRTFRQQAAMHVLGHLITRYNSESAARIAWKAADALIATEQEET
jgi:hypothetical protein